MDQFTTILGYPEIAIRIFAAIFIGGVIGYEREKNNRPAGFRTHILVCLGACIISIIQDRLRIDVLKLIENNPAAGNAIKLDLGRLGAQVISGIGFLGAGSIMRERGTIGGLTTAAGIWSTGCIGLAIGWGFYQLTFIATIAVILTLIVMKKIEFTLITKKLVSKILVEYRDGISVEGMLEVSDYLKGVDVRILSISKNEEENNVLFTIRMKKSIQISDILMDIANIQRVKKVRKEE